jgi:hypothetical protein
MCVDVVGGYILGRGGRSPLVLGDSLRSFTDLYSRQDDVVVDSAVFFSSY